MQNLNFLETELLDILFRGKNKNYGAYTLRKYYPQRLKVALAAMAFGLLSFLVLHLAWPVKSAPSIDFHPPESVIPPIKLISIELPAGGSQEAAGTIIQKANPDIPTQVVERAKITPPVDRPEEKETIQPIIPGTEIGGLDDGLPSTGVGPAAGPPGEGLGGTGTAKNVVTPPAPDPNEPILVSQVMPQFPGGEEALFEYLRKNLNYPIIAKRANISGTVHVEFVVNRKGNISDVKILKGLGYGCDEETIRVIKSMPTWSPGENQGHKVSVSYNIPVTFEMSEF